MTSNAELFSRITRDCEKLDRFFHATNYEDLLEDSYMDDTVTWESVYSAETSYIVEGFQQYYARQDVHPLALAWMHTLTAERTTYAWTQHLANARDGWGRNWADREHLDAAMVQLSGAWYRLSEAFDAGLPDGAAPQLAPEILLERLRAATLVIAEGHPATRPTKVYESLKRVLGNGSETLRAAHAADFAAAKLADKRHMSYMSMYRLLTENPEWAVRSYGKSIQRVLPEQPHDLGRALER